MRDWRVRYADKVVTAEEAIREHSSRAAHPHRLGGGGARRPGEGDGGAGQPPGGQRGGAPADAGAGALRGARACRALPAHRLLHRRQRAQRGAGGPRGLHAGVPLGDPRAHPQPPGPGRRGAAPGEPAGRAWLRQPRASRWTSCAARWSPPRSSSPRSTRGCRARTGTRSSTSAGSTSWCRWMRRCWSTRPSRWTRWPGRSASTSPASSPTGPRCRRASGRSRTR